MKGANGGHKGGIGDTMYMCETHKGEFGIMCGGRHKGNTV